MTGGVDVKWLSSSTVVGNIFSFGLDLRALGGVGCKENVDYSFVID